MDRTQKEHIIEAACAYHKKGWQVIAKTPPSTKLKSWLKGTYCKLNDNINDLLPIARHNTSQARLIEYFAKRPNAGLGIITGKKSGLVVVDVDEAYGGAETLKSLNLPKTLTVKSPNGLHLYYQYPENTFIGNYSRIRPGLDIRGEYGTINVPPSVNAYGIAYYWQDPNANIQPLPEIISDMCKAAKPISLHVYYYLGLRRKYYDYAVHRLLDILFNHHPK